MIFFLFPFLGKRSVSVRVTRPGSSARLQSDTGSAWMVPWAAWRSEQEEQPEKGVAEEGWHWVTHRCTSGQAEMSPPLIPSSVTPWQGAVKSLQRLQSEINSSRGFLPGQPCLLRTSSLSCILMTSTAVGSWRLPCSFCLWTPRCAVGNPS